MVAKNQHGFTLFEILISVVLLGIISAMIYSVLNMSIRFVDKGEERIRAIAREQGVHNLLRRQVESAFYDSKKRAILMSTSEGGDIVRLATRSPLINRSAGLVMAFYRYEPGEDALYYGEKRDFFNIDYDEAYEPRLDEMHLLTTGIGGFSALYDEESGGLRLEFRGRSYSMIPRCVDLQQLQATAAGQVGPVGQPIAPTGQPAGALPRPQVVPVR